MTDHNREEREALIEAARRLLNDVNPKHRPAPTSLMADDIRAVASSVFEQATAPTDDERSHEFANMAAIMRVPELQAEPTDAQVIAALNAYQDRRRLGTKLGDWGSVKVQQMRAALRAAFQVKGEGR